MSSPSESHVTNGVLRILELPLVYRTFQWAIGGRRAARRFIDEWVAPQPGMRVLDLGCGPGSLLEFLPSSVEYVGVDVNEHYLATARRVFGPRGTFVCADASGRLPVDGPFDRVLAAGLLHHLPDDAAQRLLAAALACLGPSGLIVTRDMALVSGQAPWVRWLMSRDRGRCIRTLDGYASLARVVCPVVDATLVTGLARVPYSHCILRAGISAADPRRR